jgi:hypothetical protein
VPHRIYHSVTDSNVWPELTIRAVNQDEVDCLLYALTQAGVACLVRPGFAVEVGAAKPEEILRIVAECLTQNGIDSVRVALSGKEHVLQAEAIRRRNRPATSDEALPRQS